MPSTLNAVEILNTTDAAEPRAAAAPLLPALRSLTPDELEQVAGGRSPEVPNELPVHRW